MLNNTTVVNGGLRRYFRGRMSPRTPHTSRPTRRPRKPGAEADRARATQELRALAHPLRLRLLEEFAGAPRTTMQVAASIGEPPTRLYHHVNALERAGILRLARTRQVRGTTEKYYEVTKKSFGVVSSSKVTGSIRGPLRSVAHAMFEQARDDLMAAIADAPKQDPELAPVALRMLLRLSPAQVASVRGKILALLSQIQKECKGQPRSPDVLRWALTVAFAPRGRSAQE
jgi:DNA-binding transcriptional ArsR family regulator